MSAKFITTSGPISIKSHSTFSNQKNSRVPNRRCLRQDAHREWKRPPCRAQAALPSVHGRSSRWGRVQPAKTSSPELHAGPATNKLLALHKSLPIWLSLPQSQGLGTISWPFPASQGSSVTQSSQLPRLQRVSSPHTRAETSAGPKTFCGSFEISADAFNFPNFSFLLSDCFPYYKRSTCLL